MSEDNQQQTPSAQQPSIQPQSQEQPEQTLSKPVELPKPNKGETVTKGG